MLKNKRRVMTEEEELLFGIDKLNVPRSSVPAITHVDYSARIQTVHADTNKRYHDVISKFKEKQDVHSLLTPHLTCAASQLFVHRQMHLSASWELKWIC